MGRAAGMSMTRARLSGLVCLLYLGSIEAVMIAVGRNSAIYDAAGVMANVFYLMLALLFYGMFKPVSRRLSLLASAFGVLGCTLNLLQYATHGGPHVKSIPFLALFILLTGVLMIRSGFLPQILGWLQVLSGLGWLVSRLPLGRILVGRHIADFDFLVQGLLGLWLIIKGIDLECWSERGGALDSSLPAEA